MGLFSKLFGSNENAEKAKSTLEGLLKSVAGAVEKSKTEKPAEKPASSGMTVGGSSIPVQARPASPSGESWGEEMPAEPNQFNSGLRFDQYFEEIFRTEFSDYSVQRGDFQDGRRVVFTFMKNGRKALVVELLNQQSSAVKLRKTCLGEGTPYLRYYYDHEGWWNTRAYVIKRTRAALAA